MGRISELKSIKGFKASKRMGQNFLMSTDIARMEASYAERKCVVEFGAGSGILTKELCALAKSVIAVEKDTRLFNILREKLDFPNLKLINSDFFDLGGETFNGCNIMVSNVPYSLSSKTISWLAEKQMEAVLCLQKDFVGHMLARPGSVFNLYTGFEGTFVSSPWIIRTNYNENSLVNNGFSVSAAIANQPNPGENDTYGSGFGYMYVSSLGSTSGGPEFCWDSAGSCVTSAPLTKVGIYSLAYPGGGATGSAYFLLDSGSGGGSWGVDWAFIATYPYNGVMPSFSLGPVYPVNSMA